MNVLVICGSLRREALTKALGNAVQKLAPKDMAIEIYQIGGFPLYDDVTEETAFPEIVKTLRGKIAAADGTIVITPEYNRSMPGSLKNVLDWSSRPDNEPMPWVGKPVGVLSVSDGVRGGSFANYDVRRILTYFDAHVMGQPELHFGEADKKMSLDGVISDETSKKRLSKFLNNFKSHVEKLKPAA